MTIGFIELERRVKALEEKLEGQKSLTFTDPECNTPCTASLEQKVERLISYFDKRSRENEKHSEKLDKEFRLRFCFGQTASATSTAPTTSQGKADAYERAAEKVRELLGEPKSAAYPMYTPTAEESKVWKDNPKWTGPTFKKPAEKWIVEFKSSSGDYGRSLDVPEEFSSETAALTAIAEVERRSTAGTKRRARRIDVLAPEKWITEYRSKRYPDLSWVRSGDLDVRGIFASKVEAEAAIAKNEQNMGGYKTIVRRARRIG